MSKAEQSGRSLFSRIALAVVCGFLLLHLTSYYFYGHERMVENARTFAMGVAGRAYALDSLLAAQPELLDLMQSDSFQIRRTDVVPEIARRQWPHNDEIIEPVRVHLADLGMANAEDVQLWYLVHRGPPRLLLLLPSIKGGFLEIVSKTHVTAFGYGSMVGVSMTLLLVIALLVVLLILRRLSKQLGRFVIAAEQLGNGQASVDLPESVGPRELRRASAAFNSMQTRVLELLNERADMLAGISHDLRTLCTRLGLRLEFVENQEQRGKAEHDIELMTGILDQALTFARDEHSDEPMDTVDLSSMLRSLIDELSDEGATVTYNGLEQHNVQAQPVALMRLFSNLLDNAIKYGGAATVELSPEQVVVRDPGEGFSADQAAAAVRPYVRLDSARSQVQPGTGLGLSIAHNICRRHGWQLSFAQTTQGFEARVTLG